VAAQGIDVPAIAVGVPDVSLRNYVNAPAGFDSELFGNVFYAGPIDGIRPQGSDFNVFGDAHLWRHLDGITLGDMLVSAARTSLAALALERSIPQNSVRVWLWASVAGVRLAR